MTAYLELYNEFIGKYPDADKVKVRDNFPTQPSVRVPMTREVSLHEAAILALMKFTKVKTKEEFLRAGKQALHAIHAVALGFSGVLRQSLKKERLAEEEIQRGCVVAVPSNSEEVSIFNGSSATRLPSFVTNEEEKLFRFRYKTYVRQKLEGDYLKGLYRRDGDTAAPVVFTSRHTGDHVKDNTASTNLDP